MIKIVKKLEEMPLNVLLTMNIPLAAFAVLGVEEEPDIEAHDELVEYSKDKRNNNRYVTFSANAYIIEIGRDFATSLFHMEEESRTHELMGSVLTVVIVVQVAKQSMHLVQTPAQILLFHERWPVFILL